LLDKASLDAQKTIWSLNEISERLRLIRVLSTLIFSMEWRTMKVLLYFEGESIISKSGIGRAMKHQKEDFRDSFVLSNQVAPLFKKHLTNLYSSADCIITPTPYSKSLLEGYGITIPIVAISNGVDVTKYQYDSEKVNAFYRYFYLTKKDKIIVSAGLHIKRKGIIDFIEVAKRLPEYTFIWFGHTAKIITLKEVREVLEEPPKNVRLPGYVKGPVFEGAFSCADAFFFPSYEETEGIVVLEALAASQEVIIRDIGVYDPWLISEKNCFKGKTNDEFVDIIKGVVEKKHKTIRKNAFETAELRSLEIIGQQLKCVYEKVLNKQ
jgi:1,2-diacylglycerol-3-alpha-glucose alpha-1,2-glucosyltransferase